MAGGIGSRFWPMSTPEYPKQFIDVMGVGKSLLQLTVERFSPICDHSHFWVVTSEKYVDIVKEQLPNIPQENILAEPAARNTAPCIAYACWKIKSKYENANIVVTPSDALVLNTSVFANTIQKALDFTQDNEAIITIGISPTRPETGYGYICSSSTDTNEIQKVNSFREKPNLETAKEYLNAGNYFWNAGIFVWNIHTIENALRQYAPKITQVIDKMALSFNTKKEKDTIQELFPTCEKVSIDYAVMEKSPNIYVLTGEFGWSDLGSWGSLHQQMNKDEMNNAIVGENIRLFDCKNCVVHVSNENTTVLQGLDGYIVAEKGGRLLICQLQEEQRIKEFSAK